MTLNRDIAVDGSFNVRDLGGYPAAQGATAWRRLLRSGGVHRLSPAGIATLRDHGVTRVIDLRRPEELAKEPSPLRDAEGITLHEISLFEGLAPTAFDQGDVLLDLYIQALDSRAEAFVAVFEAMAASADGAVMFHCTAGKDRTGLIAALLLLIAGVDRDTIIADYTMTEARLAQVMPAFLADAEARGADLDRLRPLLLCAPETMAATLDHIETLGGARAWLLASGLSPAALDSLAARLAEEA